MERTICASVQMDTLENIVKVSKFYLTIRPKSLIGNWCRNLKQCNVINIVIVAVVAAADDDIWC